MAGSPIDTNVIVRYLTEDPGKIQPKFRGITGFFKKLQTDELTAELPELVLFQVFFVLTSVYRVPASAAAAKLAELVAFRGLQMENKTRIELCLRILIGKNIDLVDAYLLVSCQQRNSKTVYSFDKDLEKLGLELLDVR